ncbi:hypothetical protein [Fusicatenibacter saccharivorans]|uniref:hypothetical protein n=1 Tax=Fusicatenibacter saccharivorans TaxID=1150298 RepID=UPI003D092478
MPEYYSFIGRPLEPYIVQRRVKNILTLHEKQETLQEEAAAPRSKYAEAYLD